MIKSKKVLQYYINCRRNYRVHSYINIRVNRVITKNEISEVAQGDISNNIISKKNYL